MLLENEVTPTCYHSTIWSIKMPSVSSHIAMGVPVEPSSILFYLLEANLSCHGDVLNKEFVCDIVIHCTNEYGHGRLPSKRLVLQPQNTGSNSCHEENIILLSRYMFVSKLIDPSRESSNEAIFVPSFF